MVSLLQKLGYDTESLREEWPAGRPLSARNPPDRQALRIPKNEDNFVIKGLQVKSMDGDISGAGDVSGGRSGSQNFRVDIPSKGTWYINTKVVLEQDDLINVASLAVRFAPVGSTVHMQADTHGAGNVYVGMIMSFEQQSIPINMISGDIGCGLSVVPLIGKNVSGTGTGTGNGDGSFHLKEDQLPPHFFPYALAIMRRTLKRGHGAEEGNFLSKYIMHAINYYGTMELPTWLDEMRAVLEHVDISFSSYDDGQQETYGELTRDQSCVLRYIGRYAQSLGSSGNHFMELSTDDEGYLWAVVHSGSRGLGAKVYHVIAEACRIISCAKGFTCEVATGELAVFYARAYDCLNKFAKLNRIMCAVAVMHDLGLVIEPAVLQHHMKVSHVFNLAAVKCQDDGEAILSLMSGLTHNGIKAYVNDETQQVIYVLSKGAISMTRRASASIVALRSGDGCYVWTLADLSCPWKEVDIRVAVNKGYQTVTSCDGIIFSGHGAGRSRSTTKTAGMSTYADVEAFFRSNDIWGNIAPGILGDNPRIAYNDVPTILSHLPLDIACTKSQLRTRLAHKEGISTDPKYCKMCAAHIESVWDAASPDQKLCYDLNLCRKFLKRYEKMDAERQQYLETLAKEMGLSLDRSH